jgi:YcaO-like protein with predicted kinase domain
VPLDEGEDAARTAVEAIARIDLWSQFEASLQQECVFKFASEFGVTRIGWTTLLDRLSIPTCYCVRPAAKHPICAYSSGKGFDERTALLSGVFEAYERWAAEESLLTFSASLPQLKSQIGQFRNVLVVSTDLVSDDPTYWSVGRHLLTEQAVIAHSSLVEFPPRDATLTISTTTGLAAHTSHRYATESGILECIERHASANMTLGKLLRVGPACLSEKAKQLVNRMCAEGIECHLFVIDDTPHLAWTVYCYAYDNYLELPQLQCSGFGAALSVAEAADKALLEVCQSRAAMISGLRDDVSIRVSPKSLNFKDIADQRAWRDQLRMITGAIPEWHSRATETSDVRSLAITGGVGSHWAAFPLRACRGLPAVRVLGMALDDCY